MQDKLAASGRAPTIVVIDDFFTNPDAVRDIALRQDFQADNNYFRGKRSVGKLPWPCVTEAAETRLGVTGLVPTPVCGVFQICVAGDQLVYHSDANDYAAVLFLTPNAPPEAGTTLYRSKATKGRTVAESLKLMGLPETAENVGFVEQQMYGDKLLDRTAWEVVDVVGNVYNRLVVWNARAVHAASAYFGTTPANGRLFQMYFWSVSREKT